MLFALTTTLSQLLGVSLLELLLKLHWINHCAPSSFLMARSKKSSIKAYPLYALYVANMVILVLPALMKEEMKQQRGASMCLLINL